jgi:hypothetical protein
MIKLCPTQLFYRLNERSRRGLILYQRDNYGLELDIPTINYPAEIDTEEADREMRKRPKSPVKVK